jgi:hypothetical protein
VGEWAREYGVNLHEPVQTRRGWKEYVTKRVRGKVHKDWRKGMEGKSSLRWYSSKEKMGMEGYWDGSRGATLIFKARVGDLTVGKRDNKWAGREDCWRCGAGVEEDIPHLLLECPAYQEERDQWGPGGQGLNRGHRTSYVLGLGRHWVQRDQWAALGKYLSSAWAKRQAAVKQG